MALQSVSGSLSQFISITVSESPPQASQVTGQLSEIVMPFHEPSQPNTTTAVAQSIGVTDASSSAQSAGHVSQVIGQPSEIVIPFHEPSQPNTATAVAQSIGVIDASSSAQALSITFSDVNAILDNPDKPLQL